MAKRGYKLRILLIAWFCFYVFACVRCVPKVNVHVEEFVAHAGNVNCLSFGKKNCRVFITGGDDQKVNLWSVGKPTSLMSLCGHTSPVESAAFDSAEVLVVAGSSSGAIKLWDLEETKMVRTLSGHRSYCTAVEFHPFGEFFASGSMDTNLKIWDIRKKGCIHTYKGHTRGISTIRFTPDGRWVVSGGFDNVVKATGVRAITFHPDGRTLFCGLDDALKVYSWEPVICHDSVDMGWSTLGDLCIHDGKLLGGAYYENSVAVWVADVSLIEPYGTRLAPEQHNQSEQKCDTEQRLMEKEESHVKLKSNLRSTTPDSDSKEIKTIYVDRVNSVTSKTVEPVDVPKVVHPSDSKEISTVGIQKRGPQTSLPAKSNAPAVNRSLIMPSIVPRDGPDGKDSVGSRRESIASGKASSGISAKPPHTRRLSSGRFDMERMSVSLESVPLPSKKDSNVRNRLVADENAKESSEEKQQSISRLLRKRLIEPHHQQQHQVVNVVINLDSSLKCFPVSSAYVFVNLCTGKNETRTLLIVVVLPVVFRKLNSSISCQLPHIVFASNLLPDKLFRICDQILNSSKGVNSVKVVNGVAVVRGRTRSLVERFERKEKIDVDEIYTPNMDSGVPGEPIATPLSQVEPSSGVPAQPVSTPPPQVELRSDVPAQPVATPPPQPVATPPSQLELSSGVPVQPVKIHRSQNSGQQIALKEQSTLDDNNVIENLMQNHDVLLSTFRSRLTKLQVVRHFWERNDVKGAINAVKKLPDHSVQADVVGVLIERMEVITLDLFCCLLPVLLGLLDSKVERHASVSLEMLLKLVAVFGTVVRSTVSAPPAVGVDLHAEERLECCKRCFAHLQNVQKMLPELVNIRSSLFPCCAIVLPQVADGVVSQIFSISEIATCPVEGRCCSKIFAAAQSGYPTKVAYYMQMTK
ncbi:UNVERIFIED_CONTAM: Katanin p80 WD40 repeat-containing subunit B1 [Sesamum calycinum]|uniref:Katanin p80 WD40 repeat-containing subunit B1 homolog n=1 Tax=Sesamum calycinum TaxID=2727403 RepID=A0AAW2Q6C1_9LAMI